MRRIFLVVVTIPLAIVLIALSVANREPVLMTLDPFNPGNPALSISIPLYVAVIAAMIVGAIIGGAFTWLKQGKYRSRARTERNRADEIRREADQLRTERETLVKEASLAALPKA